MLPEIGTKNLFRQVKVAPRPRLASVPQTQFRGVTGLGKSVFVQVSAAYEMPAGGLDVGQIGQENRIIPADLQKPPQFSLRCFCLSQLQKNSHPFLARFESADLISRSTNGLNFSLGSS